MAGRMQSVEAAANLLAAQYAKGEDVDLSRFFREFPNLSESQVIEATTRAADLVDLFTASTPQEQSAAFDAYRAGLRSRGQADPGYVDALVVMEERNPIDEEHRRDKYRTLRVSVSPADSWQDVLETIEEDVDSWMEFEPGSDPNDNYEPPRVASPAWRVY